MPRTKPPFLGVRDEELRVPHRDFSPKTSIVCKREGFRFAIWIPLPTSPVCLDALPLPTDMFCLRVPSRVCLKWARIVCQPCVALDCLPAACVFTVPRIVCKDVCVASSN